MKIWIGSPTDVRKGEAAEKALATQNDAKFWDEEKGIVKVDHARWQAAQRFESEGWTQHWRTASSDRNNEHKTGFEDYAGVPQNLGRVIEIGCGPFTQLQTIAEHRSIDHVTLLDPLLEQYKQLPNCTYRDGTFSGHKTNLICNQAEALNGIEEYDTAICINVLEHVQDVEAILHKLYRSIAIGGTLVFGERCYDGLDINAVYDVGHPIRPKLKVFRQWEKQFEPIFLRVPALKDPLDQMHHFIGRKA